MFKAILSFLAISLCLWVESNAQWVELRKKGAPVLSIATNSRQIFLGEDFDGIQFSSDNGRTWVFANNGMNGGSVYSIAVFGTSIIAGTYRGIYLSTDNGKSWIPKNQIFGNFEPPVVRSILKNGSNIIAVTDDWVVVSPDNGRSWTLVRPQMMRLTSLCKIGSKFFAGAYQNVYVSQNNGKSWNRIYNELNQLSNVNVTALAALDSVLFAGTLEGILKSTDFGIHWVKLDSGLTDHLISALHADGKHLYAGTRRGVFRLNEEGTYWKSLGLSHLEITAIAANDSFLLVGANGFPELGKVFSLERSKE